MDLKNESKTIAYELIAEAKEKERIDSSILNNDHSSEDLRKAVQLGRSVYNKIEDLSEETRKCVMEEVSSIEKHISNTIIKLTGSDAEEENLTRRACQLILSYMAEIEQEKNKTQKPQNFQVKEVENSTNNSLIIEKSEIITALNSSDNANEIKTNTFENDYSNNAEESKNNSTVVENDNGYIKPINPQIIVKFPTSNPEKSESALNVEDNSGLIIKPSYENKHATYRSNYDEE